MIVYLVRISFDQFINKWEYNIVNMTYIDYMNLFWKTSQSVKFSSNEAYLYFFLLSECNIRGWENPFECPNRRIILSIGISEPTLIDCRNRLQSKGLLMFEAGKRNEKPPVYYLNDLSKHFSKTFSKRFSKDLSKNLSKDPSILYKTKEYKTIDLDNISPTPPKGDDEREKKLQEKENALRALEEELKKREANLANQNSKPPAKSKEPNSLNVEARKLFEEHYLMIFSNNYYWGAKDAGSMASLLKKLKYQRGQKKMPIDDQNVLNALKYLLDSITEGWIFENFSVTNINSKFNEIVSQAIAKRNGQTTSNTSSVNSRQNNRYSSGRTNAENNRASLEHLGELADAILQCPTPENG